MVEIEVPFNESIDPADVRAAFKKRPDIKVVSLVHHDTPSGTNARGLPAAIPELVWIEAVAGS